MHTLISSQCHLLSNQFYCFYSMRLLAIRSPIHHINLSPISMSIETQPMAPKTPAITLLDSFKEAEPRCKMCSAIPWNDVFAKLSWFQCSRQDCNRCYPDDREKPSRESGHCSFEHYDSFAKLEQSADNGCQLCRVLFMELVYKYRKIKTWETGALKVVLRQGECEIDSTGCYNSTRLPTFSLVFPFELENDYRFHVNKDMRVTRQSVNLDASLPSVPKGYLNLINGNYTPTYTASSYKLTFC